MDRPSINSCLLFYRQAQRFLSDAGVSNAKHEAMWMVEQVLGLSRLKIHTEPDLPISPEQQERLWALLERRALGEPLQYLLGSQEFRGLDFLVSTDVLIPRPETELLAEELLFHVRGETRPLLVDVGTGSGCLAVSLAVEHPGAILYAIDQCPRAVGMARRNAGRHQVAQRVMGIVGDLLAPLLSDALKGKVTGIVANLPYISREEWTTLPRDVRDFEPRRALDGGSDGLAVYRRLLPEAALALSPGGVLVVEVGPNQADRLCQEPEVKQMYTLHRIRKDAGGMKRVVCLRRNT